MPAGSPQGGQWTSGGGGGASASDGNSDGGSAAPADQVALAVDPNVASDADNQILPVQNRRVGPDLEATPPQLARESLSAERADQAIARVRELDPDWKPTPVVTDPRNIESRIARNIADAHEADAHYADLLRARLGGANPLVEAGLPKGSLSGPRAEVSERDDAETRRGAIRENQTAGIVWLNNHDVEQKPDVPGPKEPDYRIDGEIFDNYAPKTDNVRNIWSTVAGKVADRQANNIIINLGDSAVTVAEINSQFRAYPIDGLNGLWVIDRMGKLFYLRGVW